MIGRALILGGTGEARALAAAATDLNIPVISSLAGRVRKPRLPVGEVRIGGFGGVGGLREWLDDNRIGAVVDATHPFAARITGNAVAATSTLGIPLLRLCRTEWLPEPGDKWLRVDDIASAATSIRDGDRVFMTTGRQDVGSFSSVEGAWFLIRVVDEPTAPLPPHHAILRSRGPYRLESERNILRDNHINVLVTKNSGGELTRAKLDAARELGTRVIMVDRPTEPAGIEVVSAVVDAVSWLAAKVCA